MSNLSTSLAQSLAGSRLANSIANRYIETLSENDLVYTRDCPVNVLYNQTYTQFTNNEKAYVIYEGQKLYLIEDADTNLFTKSDNADHADWVKDSGRLTSSSNKLIPSTDNDTHLMHQDISFAGGSQKYTLTVVVKKDEYDGLRLELPDGQFVGTPVCDFDLDAGTAGTPTDCTASIEEAESDRLKCEITAVSDSAGSGSANIYVLNSGSASYAGDGSSGIQFYRADIIARGYSTSHIITDTAATQRVATDAYWPEADVKDWVYNGKWKFYFIPEYSSDELADNRFFFNPTFSAAAYIRLASTKKFQIRDSATGLCAQSDALTWARGDIFEVTFDYPGSAMIVKINGIEQGVTFTAQWIWTAGNLIFGAYSSSGYANCYVSNLIRS